MPAAEAICTSSSSRTAHRGRAGVDVEGEPLKESVTAGPRSSRTTRASRRGRRRRWASRSASIPSRSPRGPVAADRMARHGAAATRAGRRPGGRFGVLVPGSKPCPSRRGRDRGARRGARRRTAGVAQGTIPAGFTYLGQFIDHDITFDPTPFGARRSGTRARSVNLRTPRLDLDSLYGGGPDVQPYLYDARRAREAAAARARARRSTSRATTQDRAVIGDPRNDENAIVSQLHLLFARFHNRLADELGSFAEARRIVLRHYHWIVLRRVPADGPRGPVHGAARALHVHGRSVHPRRVLRRGVPVRPLDGAPGLRL